MSIRRRLRRKLVRDRLERFLATESSDRRTLDVGCGNSRYASLFPQRVGVDLQLGRGVALLASALELPIREGQFPIVLATEVLEHVPRPQAMIDELYRVVEPGGRLILTTRFIFPLHDAPGDYFRFTAPGLLHLLRDWEHVRIRPEAGPFGSLAILLQRIVYQTDLVGGSATRYALLAAARIVVAGDRLVRRQFGQRARTAETDSFFATGYYVTASKPRPR